MRSSATPTILGIPYEEGTYWRKGAKEGPAAIRRQLAKIGNFSLLLNKEIAWDISEIDHGDIQVNCYSKSQTIELIESKISELLVQGSAPVALGGDHSITLPVVRALAKHCVPFSFGILHFDAHSDTIDPVDGYRYHHGAAFRNIVEEGLVDPKSIYQFGIRGQVFGKGLTFVEETGIRYVKRNEFVAKSCQLKHFNLPKDLPYYVSVDIDVVDPAFAPGTGTPVPGGLSSAEMLEIVGQLAEFDIIGMDVVEVAPIYDHSEITSLLAAHIVFEMLAGAHWRRLSPSE